ncbi:MAG: phenylacetate--CoA ligase family protein [Acidobacteria bacterium]|nr:phenylacetate--CoA ligase family protein [Acidobacteriota bacterium]
MSLGAWLIREAIAPAWAARERSPYLRVAAALKAHERLSLDERQHRQWSLLLDIVAQAWEQSPFYRQRFADAGFDPRDLRDWDDLRRLPVITKRDIAANTERIIAASADRAALIPRKTSGSTGVSLHFFVDEQCAQWKRGVALYRDEWTGWRLGEWRAMVWGNPDYAKNWRLWLRNALLERGFALDTLRMSRPMMDAFAAQVLARRPTMLFGHAHSLFLFADFWRQRGLPEYRPRAILSTAMVLHPHERRRIADVFGERVFDRYGCEEVSLIASECEAHSGLHLNTDSLVVEVLDGGAPAVPGRDGAVVVTDLFNRGFPLIRYQVGDMAVPAAGSCPCGRSYPLLERVAGRISDYLVTPEGEWVSGISLTENFATLIPGLYQVQIVQDRLDHLLLRVVPGPGYGPASQRHAAVLVRDRFGPEMRFDFEVVDALHPEPSGKYRFAICKLEENAARASINTA